ncbi:YrhK family protein [Conexibacter woesei]|uniref:YrhK family protein n=1 Tax=Conexibacter woesei TaxID=191495 RepID=UPI0012DD3E82|nr:YrhK family protein [Conexibacter woesei]
MNRERRMAALFVLGSLCFVVGPFPGYARLVGAQADAWTFFVGSLFFTGGGLAQALIAHPERRTAPAGPGAWHAAAVQLAGTLFFNITTYRAVHTALTNTSYDRVVWRPDAFGSTCFLISGVIAYRSSPRSGPGAWEPAVNLLGCVLFGIAAIAGYVVPASGSDLDLAAANVTTVLGAACFLACAAATLRTGRTRKSPRLLRLRADIERERRRLTPAARAVGRRPPSRS